MLEIFINDEDNHIDESTMKLIEELLMHAAKAEQINEAAEVSVTMMTDEEIQEINATYRGINQPTDVISFALEETTKGEIDINHEEGMPRILGDICISVETAKRQATEYEHDIQREIGFLALHGFLHLLGYDHMTDDDEVKMFSRQTEILDSFGLRR